MGFKGVVTDVFTTTKKEIFGDKLKFGEPMEKMVLIKYIVLDKEGNSVGKGSDAYNLNYHPHSNMHKFIKLYGAPERGVMVKVRLENEYFKIVLDENENEE